ncbi:hypothetical protein D3C85_1193610 [compost metagenome]
MDRDHHGENTAVEGQGLGIGHAHQVTLACCGQGAGFEHPGGGQGRLACAEDHPPADPDQIGGADQFDAEIEPFHLRQDQPQSGHGEHGPGGGGGGQAKPGGHTRAARTQGCGGGDDGEVRAWADDAQDQDARNGQQRAEVVHGTLLWCGSGEMPASIAADGLAGIGPWS